jgi:hypothetical protein
MIEDLHVGHVQERISGNACPKCGKLIDGATGFSDQTYEAPPQPKTGDFSVCLFCGSLLRFNKQLRSVLVTRAERHKMERDSRLKELIGLCESVTARYRRAVQ